MFYMHKDVLEFDVKLIHKVIPKKKLKLPIVKGKHNIMFQKTT